MKLLTHRHQMRSAVLLIFRFLICITPIPLTAQKIIENCDIPGSDIGGFKSPSANDCFKQCELEKTCKGAVFITGWNRCQLKSKEKPTFSIKLIAGKLNSTNQSVEIIGENKDLSGKDMAPLIQTVTATECGERCQKTIGCKAFVFIDGYRSCWLKNSVGNIKEKTFSCYIPADKTKHASP